LSEIERAIDGDVGNKSLRLSRGTWEVDLCFFDFDAMANIEATR
jgi:hypothetical protein